MKNRILQLSLLIFFFNVSFATTKDNAVIYPEDTYGKVLKHLILDLKLNASLVGGTTKANLFFQDYDMNGVRISVYGNEGHRYHPEAGSVIYKDDNNDGYHKLISSVLRSQTARGDKDFTVFASKKLKNVVSFPEWVLDGDGPEIVTEQYITMLFDYVKFMHSYDIEIDILGVDNEEKYNKADITASQYKDIVDGLTTKLKSYGYKIPLWMGYEDFDPNLRDWVSDMMNNGWDDRMDIYGVHYYPSTRKLDDLEADLEKIGDIPFWSTEAHWNSKDDQDEIAVAEVGMATLWDQTDAGLDGLCMWDFGGNESNQRFAMVKAAMLPLKDAQPIFVDDVDGTSIDAAKYGTEIFTRAFIEDSLVTVYATNTNATTDYNAFTFSLNYGVIDGSVEYIQFTDDVPLGETANAQVLPGNTVFACNIPARSITRFSFLIDPIEIEKLECEDLAYTSPTSTSIVQQGNNSAGGKYHLNLAASTIDQSIEFDVPVAETGVYKLMLVGLTWTTFGEYAMQVQNSQDEWQTLEGTLDLYGTQSGRVSNVWMDVSLQEGINKIRFISQENNSSSNGYKGSFDYIVLEKTSVASIDGVSTSMNLVLSPNPTSNILNIDGLSSNTSYRIYDLSGAMVLEDNSETIDVSELQSGVYIFMADKQTIKFLKQ